MNVGTLYFKVINDNPITKNSYRLTNVQEIPLWKKQLMVYEQHNKSRNKVSLPDKPWNETDSNI